MSLSKPDYDDRKYSTHPWNCVPGHWFQRTFVPAMHGVLMVKGDEFATWYEHVVLQNDPGGQAGPAHNAGGIGAAAIAKSQRAFARRNREAYGLLRLHCTDPGFQRELDRDSGRNAVIAWLIILQKGNPPQTQLLTGPADKGYGWRRHRH